MPPKREGSKRRTCFDSYSPLEADAAANRSLKHNWLCSKPNSKLRVWMSKHCRRAQSPETIPTTKPLRPQRAAVPRGGRSRGAGQYARRALPGHLKRERIVHDLEEAEKHCTLCAQDLREFGEETSEISRCQLVFNN